MKKFVPILFIILGVVLVIAAFVAWFEPSKEGGVLSVTGGIISFLIGASAGVKGWMDLFKKGEDEKSNQTQNQTVNLNITSTTSPIPITNHQSSKIALPNQPFFFGREKELRQIYEALRPEIRNWGVMIAGPGGIGKTALAIRAAYQAPNDLFENKIFISAKIRKLTPSGEVGLSDFAQPSYLGMLAELSKYIHTKETLVPHEPNFTNNLCQSLAEQKNLIIFDNLETLPINERDRLYDFLSHLPQYNKAIVTSRRYPSEPDVRIIPLGHLSLDDSMNLLREYKNNFHRLQRVSEQQLTDLCKITNGNPALINWIAGQLGNEKSACYTLEDAYRLIRANPLNNPLEYIFGDSLGSMTDKELTVLDAFSLFESPAQVQWISDMINIPFSELELIIHDFVQRSILIPNNDSTLFSLPALAKEYVKYKSETLDTEGK